LALALCLLSSWVGTTSGQTTNSLYPNSPLKSPSGHFIVDGPDRIGNQVLMSWVEQSARRIEQVTGMPLSFEDRSVRIIVRATNDSNAVTISQSRFAGYVVQRLFLPKYDDQSLECAREPLCRLLLNGFVISRSGKWRRGGTNEIPSVPLWLSIGISENLYPALKAHNCGMVLNRWHAGELATISEIVKAQVEEDAKPDGVVCGAFLTWLLSVPDKEACFRKMLDRIAAGEKISIEWFLPFFPDCGTMSELDERWDDWVLRQKRTIYDPGRITASFIDQVESELVLYPGDFGIPLTTNLGERIELHDLMSRREEAWIPSVARSKSMSLRVLSAGRGKEIQDVIESYARFFDELEKKRTRPETLKKLLVKAESDLERLRHLAEEAEQTQSP
jgi:hypothetical protein